MKTIRIGSGSGFWGDNLDPAIEIARHGNVQYLAYDFLGEPTIPLLQKMQKKNPAQERPAGDWGGVRLAISRVEEKSEDADKKDS